MYLEPKIRPDMNPSRYFLDSILKRDSLKVWGVEVSECWFDNQTSPNIKPIHWTIDQIKDFRKRCRKHNQLIIHGGVDPEYKRNIEISKEQTTLT